MSSLKFIHVADLHLDAAFGTSLQKKEHSSVKKTSSQDMSLVLENAPFQALVNLLALCVEKTPHFIIFAGDMYNSEDVSLRARFALRDFFLALQKMNIPVYYAHGNHDPLSSEAKKEFSSIAWPDNVFTFGEKWESFLHPLKNGGYAKIFGISHSTRHESRNLTTLFDKSTISSQKNALLNIGVLHTSLVAPKSSNTSKISASSKFLLDSQDKYAPCSVGDLEKIPMDYWALGHVHSSQIVSENPFVAYSGSVQGLHINEGVSHGCLFVEYEFLKKRGKAKPTCTFYPLAQVEWHVLDVTLSTQNADNIKNIQNENSNKNSNDQFDNILGVQNHIQTSIQKYIEEQQANPLCEYIIFRIQLFGRSELANFLREKEVQSDIVDALQKSFYTKTTKKESSKVPHVIIKDIKTFVRPCFDFDTAKNRDDILGETLRVTEELRSNMKGLIKVEKDASDILKTKIERYTSHLYQKDSPQKQSLADELTMLTYKAEEICIEVFEPQQQ